MPQKLRGVEVSLERLIKKISDIFGSIREPQDNRWGRPAPLSFAGTVIEVGTGIRKSR